jgi:hypothetical protein
MREWNTAFELYVIAPCRRCTSEAVIYSAAGQAAEVGRFMRLDEAHANLPATFASHFPPRLSATLLARSWKALNPCRPDAPATSI